MRRLASLVLPLLVAGCSIDTVGLGDDFGTVDATDDTTFEDSGSDETSPLFDAESDTGTPDTDATVTDTEPETALDTSVEETSEETSAETSVDSSVDLDADAALDAPTDTLDGAADAEEVATDATPSDALGDATDAATDTPADTGPLSSTPGKTSCSHNGSLELCTGQLCCGQYDLFSLSWKWDCSGSCIAGRDYACDEKADCSGGKVCCAKTPLIGSTIQGSDCRSSCGSDPQLCMTNAECGGSKTCQPQKAPDSPQTIGICK